MNSLPLRLTPFEQSLWVDDTPAYPWNILFRLRFAGKLERAPLKQTLQIVAARHPFLSARVRRRWTQRNWWEPLAADPDKTSPLIHWNEHEFGVWPRLQKLRPDAGQTWEVWACNGADESELLLHFHHAATDGIGAIRVIGELLQAYAAVVAGKPPVDLPPLEPQRLKRRGTYGYSPARLLSIAHRLSVGLIGIWEFLIRRPVPLLPHLAAPSEQPPPGHPLLRSRTFTQNETAALVADARRRGVTVNDLLTRDLFLTLHAWRRRRGVDDDAWLRLLVPIDLRTPTDAALPAADAMSAVFLDRRPSDVQDPAALLQSLHEQMMRIKRNHLGLIYVLMLRLTDVVPGFLAWLTRRQKFTCSAIFSNLLRPWERSPLPRDGNGDLLVGPTALRSFEFYPPLRPFTCVTYGVATYAGRLTLSLQADPRFLAAVDAEELLGEFVARVSATLQGRTDSPPTV